MHPVLPVNLPWLWYRGEMTTSFLCITHGWLCWGFRRHTGSTGRTTERERGKCARGVCMSRFCKIKRDLKLLLCHIPTQSALPEGQPAHLANPALFLLQTCMLRIPELNLNYHMT